MRFGNFLLYFFEINICKHNYTISLSEQYPKYAKSAFQHIWNSNIFDALQKIISRYYYIISFCFIILQFTIQCGTLKLKFSVEIHSLWMCKLIERITAFDDSPGFKIEKILVHHLISTLNRCLNLRLLRKQGNTHILCWLRLTVSSKTKCSLL